jgi:hypothetical protein
MFALCGLQGLLAKVYSEGRYAQLPMQPAFVIHGLVPERYHLMTPEIMVDVLKGVSKGDMSSQLPAPASALEAFQRDTYSVGDVVDILLDQDDTLEGDEADIAAAGSPEPEPDPDPDPEPLVVLARGVIEDAEPDPGTVCKAYKVMHVTQHWLFDVQCSLQSRAWLTVLYVVKLRGR